MHEADANFRDAWMVAIVAFDEARRLGDDDPFDAALLALRAAPMGARLTLAKELVPDDFLIQRQVFTALEGAMHALRSYQYGNASTELAAAIADKCEAVIKAAEAREQSNG